MSQRAQAQAELAQQIEAVDAANRKVYGSPRVHAEFLTVVYTESSADPCYN